MRIAKITIMDLVQTFACYFNFKIKIICKSLHRAVRAKVLTNAKQIFLLFCALKTLSNERFFASVLFEKRLHVVSQ